MVFSNFIIRLIFFPSGNSQPNPENTNLLSTSGNYKEYWLVSSPLQDFFRDQMYFFFKFYKQYQYFLVPASVGCPLISIKDL